jgi:hypothetical protein
MGTYRQRERLSVRASRLAVQWTMNDQWADILRHNYTAGTARFLSLAADGLSRQPASVSHVLVDIAPSLSTLEIPGDDDDDQINEANVVYASNGDCARRLRVAGIVVLR